MIRRLLAWSQRRSKQVERKGRTEWSAAGVTRLRNADTAMRSGSQMGEHLDWSFFGVGGLGLLIGAFLVIQQLSWSHLFGDISRTEAFMVGPIDPGSAVEQSFINPTEFLTGLTVAVRIKEADREVKPLVFRLRRSSDSRDLIREGRIDLVLEHGAGTVLAGWSFPTIRGMRGESLDIQISLDPAATVPIEFPVSQGDRIKGILRTNGIPTDEQIDLLLAPARDAEGLDVLRVVARDGMGLLTLVVVVPALGIAGLFAVIRYVPQAASIKNRRVPISRAVPAIPGLVGLTVAIILAAFSDGQAPEREPAFWMLCLGSGFLATSFPALALGTPYVVDLLSRFASSQGRRTAGAWESGRSSRPVARLRRSWAIGSIFRGAMMAALGWRQFERQTLGKLPARTVAPAKLLMRMALLVTIVMAAQILLVGTYEDDRSRKKTVLDEDIERGFDVLYFGDSSVFYGEENDVDKRSIDRMLDALVPNQDVVSVAQAAFHMGVFLDFVRYLARRGELPETVIVPIHVGVF